uniref:RRM domain-containing protein n=1 Tax=Kwoniella dejecticola CBS 10117 TaxID=1296121 RepID=A0A1A6A7J9_9TREE|nr:uncharacterized protein I303_03749 [Kwoniella dejecticola CBS 10117]OBR86032.1 hypothetical protein I303_03749 [Kwoniella dejecticola CBS 10117]
MSSQSAKQEIDSSPSTPATTLVQSPSPKSQSLRAEHSDRFNTSSVTPTPTHPLKIEIPDSIGLPQEQVKKEKGHIHYAPPVEFMGKPSQIVKREKPSSVQARGRSSTLLKQAACQQGPVPLTRNPLGIAIKPHPHLSEAVVYVNMYPSNVPERTIADAVIGCLPIRVKLEEAVPPEMRLRPDMWYEWMSKAGTVEFMTVALAERALAVLVNHAFFTPKGAWFSPYPPPHVLPLPNNPSAPRYIRPTHRVTPLDLPPNHTAEQALRAILPTPGDVYDAVRPWGSVRSVNSYITTTAGDCKDQNLQNQWMAVVEFWYEDEARQFDEGFGKTASLLKGWQVFIHSAPHESGPLLDAPAYQAPSQAVIRPSFTAMSPIDPANCQYISPHGCLEHKTLSTQQMDPQFPVLDQDPFMRPPPPMDYMPPWAEHNMFAGAGFGTEAYMDVMNPLTPDITGRRLSRTSMSSLTGRGRRWSLTVGETAEGDFKPTGLVADDGTIIQHGPGQHIRPAPISGPGSNSVSGLVDYSNVFVKNLDPDINSHYLSEVFSNVGQVVSARVMRDDQARSRGYGFVSFHSPEQAANAIAAMHGQKLGRAIISVTLHEPRKLRPEKIAERVAHGLPTAFGRQPYGMPRRSMSPVRTDKPGRGRQYEWEEARDPVTTDEMRSLSPSSRKRALAKKISSRVSSHARSNSLAPEKVGRAMQLLTSQDLALIPLLHDKPQLDIRIAEAFASLEETTTSDPGQAAGQSDKTRPTDDDLCRLRGEINKIDPINVQDIMPMILDMLKPENWEEIWIGQRIAKLYGLAKRKLDHITSTTEEQLMSEEKVEQSDAAANEGMVEKDLLSLDTVTMEQLVSLPSGQIIMNIESKIGTKLLDLLGIIGPAPSDLANNKAWTEKVMAKGKVERGVEIAGALAKKIDIDKLKRSQKVKVIKALIDAEDERALCELMAYPAIFNAKVAKFVDSLAKK